VAIRICPLAGSARSTVASTHGGASVPSRRWAVRCDAACDAGVPTRLRARRRRDGRIAVRPPCYAGRASSTSTGRSPQRCCRLRSRQPGTVNTPPATTASAARPRARHPGHTRSCSRRGPLCGREPEPLRSPQHRQLGVRSSSRQSGRERRRTQRPGGGPTNARSGRSVQPRQ